MFGDYLGFVFGVVGESFVIFFVKVFLIVLVSLVVRYYVVMFFKIMFCYKCYKCFLLLILFDISYDYYYIVLNGLCC